MIEKLIDKNLSFLQKHIDCDENATEVYRYALRIIYSYIIDVIALLFLAFISNKVAETILILITFAIMQVYGGGFHAKTQIRCFLISLCGWFIGVFGLEKIVSLHWGIGVAIAVVFTFLVYRFTPILNEKHPVSGDVYKRSKKIVRVAAIVFDVVLVGSIIGGYWTIYNVFSVVMILYCVSLVSVKYQYIILTKIEK